MISAFGVEHGDEFAKARVLGAAFPLQRGLHSGKSLEISGRGAKAGSDSSPLMNEIKNRVGQRRQMDPRMEGSVKAFQTKKGKVKSKYVPKTLSGPERGRF